MSLSSDTDPTPASRSTGGVTVIIPAYNEERAIGAVIADIQREFVSVSGLGTAEVEILVVDDGSQDSTAERAREAGARVHSHFENRGYGASIKTGLRLATHETIIMTDADGTYPASAMSPLVHALDSADMVVGSRRGTNVHIPAVRRPAKWLLTRVAVFLAGRRIPDLNSGLRAFRRAEALRFLSLYPRGFSFTTTITLAFLSTDLTVRYLPIDYHPRTGRSKFRPIADTKNLFLTIVRSILFFNPLRVCIPISLVFAAAALFVLVCIRDRDGNILDGTIEVLVMCGLQILLIGFFADVLAKMR